jgi:hypothetical protein
MIAFLQQRLADLSTPADPVLSPGEPSGPEHRAGPPGGEDRPSAVPDDSTFAEEQTR